MATEQRPDRQVWPTTKITLLESIADPEDTTSWNGFVQIYAPLIMRYCRRRGLHEADAADVLQDVLLQLSRGISNFRYDADRGQFRNWLGTVTHRAMLKHVSKSRRHGIGAGDSSDLAPLSNKECLQPLDAGWVEAFNAHIYRVAVKRLRLHFDDETWTAFEATFARDRQPEEVASELQRTVGWVYQAKSRIARRLKEEILYLAEDSVLFTLHANR